MNILSIQSAVAYGHVGNSAAVFPMQRLGHEVWPVYTVNFSNHTGYSSVRGPVLNDDDLRAIIDGMDRRGALAEVDVVLSGYLGAPSTAGVIVEAARRVKDQNPDALYICDPVIGSAHSGSFVDDAIPPLLRSEVVPLADYVVPNQWELGQLVGRDVSSLSDTVEAARSLAQRAVVTSCDAGEGRIGMVAVAPDEAWYVETPRVGGKIVGTGDLAAAMLAATLGEGAKASLEHMAGTLFDMVTATFDGGLDEMPLIVEQELIVAPRSQFEAVQL